VTPTTIAELAEAVRSSPHVLAVGAGTKPRLSAVKAMKISMAKLTGITEYEPSEFTFTALAGTRVCDIAAALEKRGQYLPFDPMCAEAGATLGGTVAAGLSGPGRFRFGGLRDFILGVRFVDGAGRVLRMGGKVVKNAAGFDLPKFFVGSLGRFGALAEITFKVFPRLVATQTLQLSVKNSAAAAQMLWEAARARWEAEALDLLPGGEALCLRLAGPVEALDGMSTEILARWPGTRLAASEADKFWSDLREFRWAYPDGLLVKVALTPPAVPSLTGALETLEGAKLHISAAGNVGFISLASTAQAGSLDDRLRNLGLTGLGLRGSGPLWYGLRAKPGIVQAVKDALDAEHRFPGLDD
jgi:glycolate oxidase FAD binding subunit